MTETSSQEVGAVWGGVSGEKTDSHEAGGSCEERDRAQSEGLREEPQLCRHLRERHCPEAQKGEVTNQEETGQQGLVSQGQPWSGGTEGIEDCCPQSKPPKRSEGKGPQQVACQPPHRSRGPWKHFQTAK